MNTMMKKIGLGAVLAATALSAAAPAEAQRWHGGYGGYRHHGGNVAGAALLGGIVGLGVGAAIASNHDHYYDRGYYRGYYGPPRYYYDGPYYRPHCWTQWRWDPYWGHNVPVRVCN